MIRILTLGLFTVCLTLGCLAVSVEAADAPPNFIIFVADDMAWDDCGAYGNDAIRTPHIDRLAEQGIRFDRAYLTCSSCSPSRSSMLTGRYPHNTGAGELHQPLPDDQVMVTSVLRDLGYWTAVVGKWHLGENVADQVDYREGSRPNVMGDAWVKALKERPRDQPFFLWAAHSDPHRAYQPGAVDPPHSPENVIVPPMFPDTPIVRADLALYYDEVSRFDQHIGQVLQELEQQGLTENTLVLVISDNGRPFPHCKTQVHVPGVRTPFVLRWPQQVKAGQLSKQVVSTIDIAPTLVQLAGRDEPVKSFQGKSLVETLQKPSVSPREYAFAEHNWHDYRAFERAVHSQDFAYVRNWLPDTPATPPADAVRSPTYDEMKRLHAQGELNEAQQGCFETPRPTEFLYEVNEDPHCRVNLADDLKYQETLQTMRAQLEQWQERTNDRFPGKENLSPDTFDRDTGKRL